jgi:AraC-like DNA-binding protein
MKNLYATAVAAVLPVAMTWMAPLAIGQVSVVTQHYDNNRSGANLNETILTPSNVNQNSFGLLFTRTVDGEIYAQPLYVPNVTIHGRTQNVVYVATENNSVYAFDADNAAASSPLWSINLGAPVPSAAICTADLFPMIGITSTPVIDLGASPPRMYVVAKTTENDGTYAQRLHVLDITTGQEVSGSPILISPSVTGPNGTITFDALHHLNRPGLLLYGGYVYLAFAAHCDKAPWYGWVLAYSSSNLSAPPLVINLGLTTSECGVWQSGQGMAADGTGIYMITGTGAFDYSSGGMDLGNSFVRLTSSLSVADYFSPLDSSTLDVDDVDLGSGGPLLLPSLPGTSLSLVAGGGKDGNMFILNRANLGGYSSTSDNVVQTIEIGEPLFGGPIFWAGPSGQYLYIWGETDVLKQFAWNPSTVQFQTIPFASGSTRAPFPGGIMTLSANGSANGILWATTPYQSPADHAIVPGVLHAYDATNVSTELWNSLQNSSRDNFGNVAKFCPPVIANGKVYVATFSYVLAVYGLLTPRLPAPTFSPGRGGYSSPQQVSLSSTTPGASIRYTTDGSLPSETVGTLWVPGNPITVSTTTTINAIAYESGYGDSLVSTASYTIRPGASSTPSVVQSNASESDSPSNPSQSVAFSSNTTGGNTIFVFVQYYNAPVTATVDDTCRDQFTEITGSPVAANGGTAHWFIAENINGGPCIVTVTYSPSANYGGVAVFEVLGPGGSTVTLDQYASGSGNGTLASASITPTQANSFAIAQVWSGDGGGVSLGGNWTTQERTRFSTLYQGNMAGWQALSSAAPVGFSTTVGGGPWIAMIANVYFPGGGTISQVAAPAFNPTAGAYTQPIAISTTTPNATVRYTTDGSNPSETNGTVYTAALTLTASTTIKAIAYETGYTDSAVASASYTVSSGVVATPTFNPLAGTYTQPVAIGTTTPNATIRYTTDGSTPSETNGTIYTTAIALTATTTIKAIAYEAGYTDSAIASATYTFGTITRTVVQSNATESVFPGVSSQSVAFPSSVTGGNTIFVFAQYYNGPVTTTASDTCNDQFTQITGPPVAANGGLGTAHWFIARNVNGGPCTVTVSYSSPARYGGVAIFEVSGLGGSSVTLDQYASGTGNGTLASASITPTQASSFAIAQVWSGNGGGVALGGSWTTQERTRFSTLYESNMAGWQALSSAAPVGLSTTVGGGPWIAMIANFYSSGGGTASQVATSTFTPPAGAYTQPVAIGTTTPNATIRYTTDGSTPSETNGTIYTTAIALTATTSIRAIAYEAGYTDSAVASATYTFGTITRTVVQSNATESVFPGVSSQSVAFPSSVTAGNTIFVFAQYYNGPVATTASDTCNDQFTQITGSPVAATGGLGTAHWFIARNVNGGSCTVTVSYGSSARYGGAAIFEVSGLGGSTVTLDQYASGTGNGTLASASITPTQASSFAIAQVWSSGGGGSSLGGSWTTQERTRFSTLYQGNMAGWQALSSAAPVGLSTTVSDGPWIAMIANFY